MEKTENKLIINKEIKRHKSAIIPPSQTVENNLLKKDYSDNGSNNTNTNSTTCDFKIKSNSLFAFQEFDKFSFFCDNELQCDNFYQEENKQNKINNTNEELINKDELNNTISSYSLKEFNEDSQGNNNAKKRKSAFDSMPPYFAQYLSQNYQNNEEMPNIEQNNNNIFSNIINNQFASDIRRTHTQKQNTNFINPFFAHFKNNLEQINLENRRRSQGFIPPFYNYGAFNPNFNPINNFKNIFYLNKAYNGGGGIAEKIQGESPNGLKDNINIINSGDKRDFPDIIDEFPDNYRKKSNSMAIKPNQLFNQKNQIKVNNPYIKNSNTFTFNSSQNNTKNQKLFNSNIFNNNYNILYFFQDQSNCRNVQDQLEMHKNDKKFIYNFFEKIKQDLISIIEHQFGNYVIQKLLEIIIYQENKQLINEILKIINTDDLLYEICINNYGTRVIQKTLEQLINNNYSRIETQELNNTINKLIEKHLYDLCCDKNGNHVYQKLLKVFYYEKENKNDFLYNYLSNISLEVAFLQQGATIYSAALSLANSIQKEKICIKIIDNIEKLINDKYGNYSVQAIINKLDEEKNLIEPLYLYISNNIVNLSKQKCSSNVIDTFIMKKDDYSKMLVNDMIKKNIIKEIIKDQYGNYVVQKAMNISDEETVNKIINQIKPIIPELLESNIGRKIYDKLKEQYKDIFDND